MTTSPTVTTHTVTEYVVLTKSGTQIGRYHVSQLAEAREESSWLPGRRLVRQTTMSTTTSWDVTTE